MEKIQSEFQRLWDKIGSHSVMVLSSCADNRVTSRAMSVVVIQGKFYCQTDERYLKCRQIKANPNVSLCVNNFSIEGECYITGRPFDERNIQFRNAFKKYFLASFTAYSKRPTEIVLEISPKLIYSWNYKFTKPYMEFWDFEKNSYVKKEQI